jgi:hypothetical protein
MRRMAVVASVLSIMVLVVTIGSALALDCHGRLVVIGASPWEVKERCGEPTTIEDVTKHLAPRAYDPISQIPVDILVPVQQSIWMYNVGPTRFLYDLTFQEGKLIDMTTSDDGQTWPRLTRLVHSRRSVSNAMGMSFSRDMYLVSVTSKP